MYAQLRRKQKKQGRQPAEVVTERVLSYAELEQQVACLKERDNLRAIQDGMPVIGARLTNTYGIEWVVDGHTSAPSLSTLSREDEADLDLYPAVIPQNLSPRLMEFVREVDRCTPKALVPLDTMPSLFPKRGHPNGHWVDAWSESHRILFFLDVVNLHETIFAHELAHIWIDLVLGIEDYRVLADRTDTARYSQVQFLQSFVLDQAVNKVLLEKGFDMSVVEQGTERTMSQLALAVEKGYRPPTRREAAFLASSLASAMLEEANAVTSLAKVGDHLLAARSHLPEVFDLASNFALAVQDNQPEDRVSAKRAIDHVLHLGFGYTDGEIDLDRELIVVEPRIAWDIDKHPEWMPGLPLKAKCEVGAAMARSGSPTESRWELSYAPTGGVQIRFQLSDRSFTEPTKLTAIDRIPESNEQSMKRVIEMSQRNQRRIDEIVKIAQVRSSQTNMSQPSNQPPMPGPRSYSTGLAQWITQVRLEELLGGEHPYSYANNNPVNYTDPDGLQVQDPLRQWGDEMTRGLQDQVQTALDEISKACPKLPSFPQPCGPIQRAGCMKLCAGRNETFVDCREVAWGIVDCQCEGCPPYKNLPYCNSQTKDHIGRPKPGHMWPVPVDKLKRDCLNQIVAGSSGRPIPQKPGSIRRAPCKYSGTCYGKSVVVTVGYNPKPCISNAWMP